MKRTTRTLGAAALLAAALYAWIIPATAQNTNSNIAATLHNLSASGTGTVKATSQTQICVFCHTPHAANAAAPAPLWNRQLSSATYTPYTSNSLDAQTILGGPLGQPGGSSKLCLSCHDGTLAIGTVSNAPGSGTGSAIAMSGTDGGNMPAGDGETSGFTRKLGTDLRNDHPISFTFDTNLATTDGELRSPPYSPGGTLVVGVRSSGVKPLLPLDHNSHVQCTTCHDPHLAGDSIKFLRLNRFQKAAPTGGDFSAANDQICLGCHDKLGTSWSMSAHADTVVADEAYTTDAANRRQFPLGTKVWEAACLNCHDTHTAQGTRRLLREGVSGSTLGTGSGQYKVGSTAADPASVSAIEETCYQCHQGTTTKVIGTGTGTVPNIKTEFERTRRMPIATADQGGGGNTLERHDISNADFIETPELLGLANHGNRHVECTDCHNPHRVLRNALFNGQGSSTARTHVAGGTSANKGADGNVASGVLRGTWGVEPTYGTMGTNWPQVPTSYTVKKGDPGNDTSTARSSTYLTREYQLCFKCHSDYGGTSGGNMPTLGYPGGTPSGTNQMTRYTNIAAEFAVNATDPPSTGTDQGEETNTGTACGGGDCNPTPSPPGGTNNHRSWHPVMFPTGRTPTERGSSSFSNIRVPFAGNVGTQTMHCSDCHGDAGSWTQGTGPNTNVQGPHGSGNNFLLKGSWVAGTGGNTPNSPGFCGNCHNPANSTSGFASGNASHAYEDKDDAPCTFCHIAVPHGWKNKAFLVNLTCVGPENGETSGFDANGCKSKASNYTAGPYYVNARLSISSWAVSGSWSAGNCQGTTWMQDNCGSF